MHNLTGENIILMCLGVAIASITSLTKFMRSHRKRTFSQTTFVEENILPFFLSLCGGTSSLMLTDVVFHVMGVVEVSHTLALAHAFLSGLVPQFFIDRIKHFFIK